jgi:succinate dehydrogenase / fumarate reductase flavoprotein subunit/fumarate reductase (CoM/CoB) subunit A
MGGIAVDERLMSRVPGLFAAGEAAGGANGANRLSGNAIPEALVFGERAGRSAAAYAIGRRSRALPSRAGASATDQIRGLANGQNGDTAGAELLEALREVMWRDVGPLRNATDLSYALTRIGELRAALSDVTVAPGAAFNAALGDWFELRASLLAAEAVTSAAAARCESRGAHQRDDFPDTDSAWARSLRVSLTAEGAVTVNSRR